jgi:hypothetical protein
MRDVLDHTVHSAAEELFVLVVHGHDDEQLCTARRLVVDLAKCESRVFKVVGVAGGCGIPHVRELALIAECAHVEELLRDFVVEDEVAVEEPVFMRESVWVVEMALGRTLLV